MSALDFVHCWVPRPGATETILLLHGTGADENDLVPIGERVAPHASLLSPRGKVLENALDAPAGASASSASRPGGMPRFFRRFGEGMLDIEDLKRRAHELADFVAAASKEYGFDPRRVTALGYSNGANAALGVLFERPESLARAVLMRAVFPYEPRASVDLRGKRVLLLAGAADPYSRAPVTDKLADALSARGADVRKNYARAGHELSPADLTIAQEWLIS